LVIDDSFGAPQPDAPRIGDHKAIGVPITFDLATHPNARRLSERTHSSSRCRAQLASTPVVTNSVRLHRFATPHVAGPGKRTVRQYSAHRTERGAADA